MEYMKIIEKSFANAWRYRFLWLFGFFVSITESFRGGFSWTDKLDRHEYFGHYGQYWREEWLDLEPVIIAMVVVAVLLIGILIFLLSILSEGALIRGISRKELGLETGFSDCWKTGWDHFFRLFGIIVPAIIVVISFLMILVIVNIPFWFVSKIFGLLITLMSIPLFFIFIIGVVAIEGWAIRYAILYDTSWLTSIAKGWTLFKNNIGKTLGIAFSSFLSQIIAWIVLVLATLMLAIPFVILGIVNLWLGLLPGLSLLLLIIILSSAYFGTFASSVWTMGFMRLTGFGEAVSTTEPAE